MLGLMWKHALAFAAVLAAASCSPQAGGGGEAVGGTTVEKAEFSTEVAKNTYGSKAFALTVTAPDGWFVADSELTQALMDRGKDIATSGKADLKALTEVSLQNSGQLFAFFQHAPGSPVESNSAVMGLYENVKSSPGIKTGADYFFQAKKMMAQSAAQYEYLGDYKTRKIGGQDFTQMDLRLTMAGGSAEQSYYATRHGDFVVMFIQSYTSDAERAATDAIIDTVKLGW